MLASPFTQLQAHGLHLSASCACRGALQLASPEVKFEIDRETHDPLDVGMYQVSSLIALAGTALPRCLLRSSPLAAGAASRGPATCPDLNLIRYRAQITKL